MRKLIAITALAAGLLLILVPRFILPACEYEGYPAMHCSNTAHAEFAVGAALMAVGVATFFLRKSWPLAGAAVALVLFCVSFWLPDKIGYCLSPRMPCHYGMVPGIRFIDAVGSLLMIIAAFGLLRSSRKKGNP